MPASTQKTFDVRPHLARGEEPFPLIRAKVDALAAGHALVVIAPFMPAPLIELLRSEGFATQIERRQDAAWSVTVRRPV